MGKRTEETHEIHPRNFYPTPKEAVVPMKNIFSGIGKYYEPCAGDGALILHINEVTQGEAVCVYAGDIEPNAKVVLGTEIRKENSGKVSLDLRTTVGTGTIITNPPWDWKMLQPLLSDWLLFDWTVWLLLPADWKENVRTARFMKFCTDVYPIGRLKWIPETKHTGKDNCDWYRFNASRQQECRFHPRQGVYGE